VIINRNRRRYGNSTPGQSLVEFALVLPVILFLMVVLIELGMIFYVQVVLTNAAWEGARAGATAENPSQSDREIAQAVREAAYGLNPDQLEVMIDPAQDEFPRSGPFPLPRGEKLSVVVSYTMKLSVPARNLSLSSKAVTTLEYQNP
jgi:hypothetical protein